jgi:hypothetical protein
VHARPESVGITRCLGASAQSRGEQQPRTHRATPANYCERMSVLSIVILLLMVVALIDAIRIDDSRV